MKHVMQTLRGWFKRIKCALWLHPEFDAGKRAVLFGAVAVVAAGMLSQVPKFLPEMGEVTSFSYGEFTDVIRRAFVPRLYVNLYKTAPLLAEFLS